MLKPAGERVLVKKKDATTQLGVELPDGVKRDDLLMAEVVETGVDLATGRPIDTILEIGDLVWVPRQGLVNLTYNEEKHLVVRVIDCWAVIKK